VEPGRSLLCKLIDCALLTCFLMIMFTEYTNSRFVFESGSIFHRFSLLFCLLLASNFPWAEQFVMSIFWFLFTLLGFLSVLGFELVMGSCYLLMCGLVEVVVEGLHLDEPPDSQS